MDGIEWLDGVYNDKWVRDVVTLSLRNVSTIDFRFYLPPRDSHRGKSLSLESNNEEFIITKLERGAITEVNATIPSKLSNEIINLRFSEPEDAPHDRRWLGALCVKYRFNDNDWQDVPGEKEGGADEPAGPRQESTGGDVANYSTTLSRLPLVSIVVTNFNGSAHLPALLESLRNQTYQNMEIIFVDDNSADDSIEAAKALGIEKVFVTPGRAGFTGANNLGFAKSTGELVALLNNDTCVDRFWLEALVTRMQSDPNIGAVTSKIRFFTKFYKLEFSLSTPFELDLDRTLRSTSYEKFFVRVGVLDARRCVKSWRCADGMHRVEVHLPSVTNDVRFYLQPSRHPHFRLKVNDFKTNYTYSTSWDDVIILSPDPAVMAKRRQYDFYIINNAGTMENHENMPFDRGFGEVDNGQFDDAMEVPYFCGCSVLLRRDALKGRQVFIDEMFAYFEDSELSLRVRENGYKIVYDPRSVVYHKHSSTTVEYSAFWRIQTMQNSAIFRFIRNPDRREDILFAQISHLNHLFHWHGSQTNLSESEKRAYGEIPKIIARIKQVCEDIRAGTSPRRAGLRIGIFNPYWETLGGGEVHALNFAAALSDVGTIELISTRDFDIQEVLEYFSTREFRPIKRIVAEMTPDLTEDYDIFVNSCYMSALISRARLSYYLVSFPHKLNAAQFLDSYVFLANSMYTLSWMKKRWRDQLSARVLYPSVGEQFRLGKAEARRKERLIISVGRFVAKGHIKNQLEIVEAFNLFCKAYPRSPGWKLALIGSVNDEEYLQKVTALAEGSNVEILSNAPSSDVVDIYRRALVYVHACGIGRSAEIEPELMEHFGIAVAQGVAAGCIPIVYNQAGPAEILREAGVGHTFSTVEELALRLEAVARDYDSGAYNLEACAEIAERGQQFGWERFQSNVREILDGRDGLGSSDKQNLEAIS